MNTTTNKTVAVVDSISGEILEMVAYEAELSSSVQAQLEAGEFRLMVERDGQFVTLTAAE